jgi:hypothetical protein
MKCRERQYFRDNRLFSGATHGRARRQLTDNRIKALKPQAKPYLVNDDNGLSLDVLASGKMSWLFRYRQSGKQERVKLGQYPAMSLKTARAARDAKATEVAEGESPALAAKLARAGLTTNPTVRVRGAVLQRISGKELERPQEHSALFGQRDFPPVRREDHQGH